jgi:sugar phosphate isomerase/epimerase
VVKLGFLTACLPRLPLDDIARWAAREGYQALEVAAWPRVGSREFEASHLDVTSLEDVDRARRLFDDTGLTISAIGYYENNLHAVAERRAEIHRHLRACIDAAARLGVACVGTFVGRDMGLPVSDNLRLAEKELPPLVDHAGERGVSLVVENCPMEGWHPDRYPGNLAYSPELWEWMFSLGLYLNFDPSHLVWLGIDPVTALRPYVHKVRHVQAKDTQVDPGARSRYSVFGKAIERSGPWDAGWWRYRVPGLGEVDWRRVVDTLYEGGYDGVISVEHEDPVWGGTETRVKQGLQIARRTLRPLLVPEAPPDTEVTARDRKDNRRKS